METSKSIKLKFPVLTSVAHTQRMFREGYQIFISVEDFETGKAWDYGIVIAESFPTNLWKFFLSTYKVIKKISMKKK
jgi:hypothetical protein